MTKPGTTRWKVVSSKKPCRARLTSDAVVCGASFWFNVISKSPQLVSTTSTYVVDVSRAAVGFLAPPFAFRGGASTCSHSCAELFPPPPQPARRAQRTDRARIALRVTGSELVADLPQQVVPVARVGVLLDPERRLAVHDAEDRAPLLRLCHDHLHGVGGGAEDAAHLGHRLHRVQDVDGEALAEEDEEAVAGADGDGVVDREPDELV